VINRSSLENIYVTIQTASFNEKSSADNRLIVTSIAIKYPQIFIYSRNGIINVITS